MLDQAIQEFLTVTLLLVINVALPPLFTFLVRYLRAKYQQARATLTQEQGVILDSLIAIAVKAEEQANLVAAIKKSGEQKRDSAIQVVQTMLDARGLTHIPANEILTRIEAAIRDGVEQGFSGPDQVKE